MDASGNTPLHIFFITVCFNKLLLHKQICNAKLFNLCDKQERPIYKVIHQK
jgi:hypothetical protein